MAVIEVHELIRRFGLGNAMEGASFAHVRGHVR